jgi:hypothetical protein
MIAKRTTENVAHRAGANGTRIRILREKRCRHKVSVLMLVHEHAISQVVVGAHFRSPSGAVSNSCLEGRGHHEEGTTVDTGPAGSNSLYNRNITENPQSLALWGKYRRGVEQYTPNGAQL